MGRSLYAQSTIPTSFWTNVTLMKNLTQPATKTTKSNHVSFWLIQFSLLLFSYVSEFQKSRMFEFSKSESCVSRSLDTHGRLPKVSAFQSEFWAATLIQTSCVICWVRTKIKSSARPDTSRPQILEAALSRCAHKLFWSFGKILVFYTAKSQKTPLKIQVSSLLVRQLLT